MEVARVRRRLAAQGFTARPVCPSCRAEVAPVAITRRGVCIGCATGGTGGTPAPAAPALPVRPARLVDGLFVPAAAARLEQATAELDGERQRLEAEQRRAVNRRARRLAAQTEQRSESAAYFDAFRSLDGADLASQCPGIYAERFAGCEG